MCGVYGKKGPGGRRKLFFFCDALKCRIGSDGELMSELTFETEEKSAIHRAACEMVSASAAGELIQVTDPTIARAAAKEVSGAFVTLKRDGKLRSCYGCYGGKSALFQALQSASIGAATKDPRFSVVQPAELEQLHLVFLSY